MTKYILTAAVLILAASSCGGDKTPKYSEEELAQIPQPQRANLPRPSGGFVLAVGEDTITSEEVIAPIRDRLTPLARGREFDEFARGSVPLVSQSLMNKVSDIILYQKARNEAPDDIDERLDKIVDSEMRKFIMGFEGDYARAEAFLKNNYGMDWHDFRQYQRKMILSSSYLQELLPKDTPVTYSDLIDCYNQEKSTYNKDATITMRLIDIDITQTKVIDPNSDQEQVALAFADSLAERARSGEDFGELAERYSFGYRATYGGLWEPVKPNSLAKPYDVLAEESENMQVGDIIGPIQSGEHIFIMKLEDRQAASTVPFEDVQKEIEQQIIMDRKKQALDIAMNKVLEEAALTGVDKFVMFCVEQIYIEANQY
jgi:parvulin-like peptidyl-prolyl isomerase